MNQRAYARQQTKERHKRMQCKSYLLKVDSSHLIKSTAEHLRLLFLEAKWLSNYAIANDPFATDYKIKTVDIKVGDIFEQRNLKCVSAQMKQGLIDKIKEDIYNLAKKKNNGGRVGKLRFKCHIRTIPLKQFGNTYKIVGKNHIRIQNIKQKLRVRGLKQIPPNAEYANAFFMQDHGDYYIRVVTYHLPEERKENKNKAIGIDLGMRNQLVFSNGVSVKYRVPITSRIRRIYQRLSKTEKSSNNRYKTRLKLQKEFYRLSSIKSDIKNKVVSYLKRNYQIVCYQDDDIKAWQRIWGRKVLDTAIGGIKDILQERISTPVEVPRDFPSTNLCQCGSFNFIPLDSDMFICSSCGFRMHRDVKAANSILLEGLNQLPMEHREAILERGRQACGDETSTRMMEYLNKIPYLRASLLYEPGSLTALA